MRKIILSLTLMLFVSVAANATEQRNSSSVRLIAPIKDNGNAKDTGVVKKKEDKSFRETILSVLLKFEK